MKELDIALQRYLVTYYDTAQAQEQTTFLRMLEYPDPDLLDWIYGRRQPPQEFAAIIGKLTGKP